MEEILSGILQGGESFKEIATHRGKDSTKDYTIEFEDVMVTVKEQSYKKSVEKLLKQYKTELMVAENCDCHTVWEDTHNKLDGRIAQLEKILKS